MGARYPYYLLADSAEGLLKEAELSRKPPKSTPTYQDIRQGFVYERVPHITLKSIANNTEIDVIWEKWQQVLEPLRSQLNALLKTQYEEWEVPREADVRWTAQARQVHASWWEARITRQKELDASIAAKAEYEHLFDRPYEDKKKVRVAGPFTVESVSPHRMLGVNEDGDPFDPAEVKSAGATGRDFTQIILENLRVAGVQQQDKAGRIGFSALTPYPGRLICAEGTFQDSSGKSQRAGILVGPEFGSVSRTDLADAAREAGESGFDVLIACAFHYDAASTEFAKLGRLPILKARMNADLHLADELKNTGKGNLFVVFGEPDIVLSEAAGKKGFYQVQVKGVDVFDPTSMEVRSAGPDKIACWFIDTEYNAESFFVRQAYFLGAGDPYKALKTTLKAEINEEAWESLNRASSRPFPKPSTGRIAVKVINHLGDEVMKVWRV